MFATSNVLPRKDWGKESKAKARGGQSADMQAADQVDGEQSDQEIFENLTILDFSGFYSYGWLPLVG